MLRYVPNALSIARILAAPLLIVLAVEGCETAYTWVLVPALLSDIADGLIARAFHLQSRLGALLDSIADTLLLLTSFYGAWVFHPEVVRQHWMAAVVLIGTWLLECVAALARYGRLSSFHTYLSKVAGYLLGIFIGVLFVFGFQPWLLYLAVGASVLGNIEELVLLALLPEWRSDVRGIAWVLRERREGTAR
ncbi:MAG: CDP-alcohol phosphatidyltransferase family protein [Gammaproteobacteria bacterium]|nr:CDP-alcohol phosphatidyltransferase family protein [Gammaproteobacteria bacterium]